MCWGPDSQDEIDAKNRVLSGIFCFLWSISLTFGVTAAFFCGKNVPVGVLAFVWIVTLWSLYKAIK